MKCWHKIVTGIFFSLIIVGTLVYKIFFFNQTPTYVFKSAPHFGPLVLGATIPFGEGQGTFLPYKEIPKAKFYVNIVQPKLWCILEDCGFNGTYVRNLGGWLQGEEWAQPEIKERFGFTPEITGVGIRSIVVIADSNSKIIGIYPNATIDKVIDILQLHPTITGVSY